MSKTYDLSNLRVLDLHDDDNKHTISYDSSKFTPKHRFWEIVTRYIVYWKRGECNDKFIDLVYNPDKIPESEVEKWLIKLHESEGAYKAEVFYDCFTRLGRVKKLR